MSQQVQLEDFLIDLNTVDVSRISKAPPDVMISVPMEFVHTVARHIRAIEQAEDAHKRVSDLCCELNERIRLLNAELDDARQPRPIEQALAVLAQAWQSAVKPAEPERAAMPDVLLEAQRAGWDASKACVSTAPVNPWPVGSPLYYEWHNGALMECNGEDRP